MAATIVALSGPVCAGKSTLAELMEKRLSAIRLKTNDLIRQLDPKAAQSRAAFQRAGDRLDKDTAGRWVMEGIIELLSDEKIQDPLVVVDAVRIEPQLRALRKVYSVVHIHLDASDEQLGTRYAKRSSALKEMASYQDVQVNRTEHNVRKLEKIADVVIATDRCTEEDVFVRVAARLGRRVPQDVGCVDVIVGGQYGSEGKGNIASYLAREYDVLVRVGGPNAGHKVFRAGGEPYTFRQLPSGTLENRNATLVIGAGAVIGLNTLLREIVELSVKYDKLLIDPQAMIIDAADVEWEEKYLKGAIGSTAQGIGAATARKILWRRPDTDVQLARSTPALKHYLADTVEFFATCFSGGKKIMLEGTQGTTLSLHHGFYPHVTSRVTTAAACLAEAGLAARFVRRVLMVCRTYPIRVGDSIDGKTSGFMSQPITFEEIAARSNIPLSELQSTEVGSVSHRPRRIAEFDWAQMRRSLLLNAPTDIALTFADYLGIDNRKAYRYEQLNDPTLRFIEELEKVGGIPVSMISTAFEERNIIDRRMW